MRARSGFQSTFGRPRVIEDVVRVEWGEVHASVGAGQTEALVAANDPAHFSGSAIVVRDRAKGKRTVRTVGFGRIEHRAEFVFVRRLGLRPAMSAFVARSSKPLQEPARHSRRGSQSQRHGAPKRFCARPRCRAVLGVALLAATASCGDRGWCPSCVARRMADIGVHLEQRLFPGAPEHCSVTTSGSVQRSADRATAERSLLAFGTH
jgi:hypothetical protein